MIIHDFVRRTPVRLAFSFGALFAATVIILFAALYWSLGRELGSRIRLRVEETRNALMAVDTQSGFAALANVVASEAGSIRDSESIFLLLDADGAYVAGNVRDVGVFSGWRTLDSTDLPRVTSSHAYDRYFAVWSPVSEGRLLVGGNDREIRETQRTLMRGLGWGLLGTMLLAGASGTLLARRAQQRIHVVAATLSAVAAGQISRRVPLSGSGDDLDRVATQINGTLEHLQRLIESVNQSSSDIAHDLKKPIGRLRQRLETARRNSTSVEEFREHTDTAIGELDTIVATFEALLRIAQIEAGVRKARFSELDLRDVITDVVDAYGAVAEEEGHRLLCALVDHDALVLGDRELLTQLFANLVENAIRHCPKGTLIGIDLKMAANELLISVSDSGSGIPPEERENVFRRLYRLEKARSTPGSGLGLALVAAVAELHGAKIDLADNRPGLRVDLRFPRARALALSANLTKT